MASKKNKQNAHLAADQAALAAEGIMPKPEPKEEVRVVDAPVPTPAPATTEEDAMEAERKKLQAYAWKQAEKECDAMDAVLRDGNKENTIAQFLGGRHALSCVNWTYKAGKVRSVATAQIQVKLTWHYGSKVDPNKIIKTYAAILLLHGEMDKRLVKDKAEYKARVDALPALRNFTNAYNQLVKDELVDGEERWVLLPGYEEECRGFYQSCLNSGAKLDDTRDSKTKQITERGIGTMLAELLSEYGSFLKGTSEDKHASEAVKEKEATEQAKATEDQANKTQEALKATLEAAKTATDPAEKAKLEAQAKEEDAKLQTQRKRMRELIDAAERHAKNKDDHAKKASQGEKITETAEKKLAKKEGTTEDEGSKEATWQQRLEQAAAANPSPRDFGNELHTAIMKHRDANTVLMTIMEKVKSGSVNVDERLREAAAAFIHTYTNKVVVAAK